MSTFLRIDSVYAAYKKRLVARGLTLSARQGQAVALLGPNGAGKSTLLKIVAGILRTTRGRVVLDGIDLTRLAPHQRARFGVGYLMQGGRVFPGLTVKENIAVAARSLAPVARAQRMREVIRLFELRSVRDQRADMLSGGWRQCLALAMTMVRRPAVLLLDEPSVGLSPALMQHVFDVLEQYRQEHGTTILLAEQNVPLALGFASRAVVLVDGKITMETKQPVTWLADGTLEPLFLGRALQATPQP